MNNESVCENLENLIDEQYDWDYYMYSCNTEGMYLIEATHNKKIYMYVTPAGEYESLSDWVGDVHMFTKEWNDSYDEKIELKEKEKKEKLEDMDPRTKEIIEQVTKVVDDCCITGYAKAEKVGEWFAENTMHPHVNYSIEQGWCSRQNIGFTGAEIIEEIITEMAYLVATNEMLADEMLAAEKKD